MKGKDISIEMTKMPPSVSMETADNKDIANYDVGEEGQITAKYKVTSKNMIDEKDPKKGYRCRLVLSNIELSDEASEKAGKMGVGRKDYKALMKKRAENKEKMQNENS